VYSVETERADTKQLKAEVSASMSYFLLLSFFLLSSGLGQWIIDTDKELGQESSLEYIAQSTSNSESVWITIRGSRPLNLQDSVKFENVSNLTLVSSRTLLDCGSKRAVGIAFFDSTDISILGLNMSECSYQWHNDSAILITNCQNVKLEALYISKSRGFAVLFGTQEGQFKSTTPLSTKHVRKIQHVVDWK